MGIDEAAHPSPKKAFNREERNEKPRSSQETKQVLLATFADFLRELSG
jgi:hypothetical protein